MWGETATIASHHTTHTFFFLFLKYLSAKPKRNKICTFTVGHSGSAAVHPHPPDGPLRPSNLHPKFPERSPGMRRSVPAGSSTTHADRQSRESSVRKTSALHWKVPVPSRSSSQLFRLGEMSFTQMACRRSHP